MTDKETGVIKGSRIYFLDNLRTFLIFLVVLCHAGWVYESSGIGGFFWIVDDPSTNNLAGIINLILDIFMMPTMFFIAGFFTPLSMKNKNWPAFLKAKFKRIMIPWIIAVLTLIPLKKIIFLYSRNLPQESWTTYFHWSNGILNQSWLWFLPVLFLFDILYLLVSRVNIDISKITLKKAVGAIFLTGFIFSFCMSMFNCHGWTKTILIDFQNERLPIYFMIFLLGSLCCKLRTFESKPKSKKLYIAVNCTAWIPLNIYVIFVINIFVNPGTFIISELVDRLLIWSAFYLSLLSMLYLMINTFRYYLDKQGRIWNQLNKNSYGVYIIHVIVMGSIALAMLNTTIPSLLKYFILTVSTYAACNLIVYFYREVIKSNILIGIMEVNAMKTVTTALLVVTLFTVTGCGKKENSADEKVQSLKPPSVSLHIAALQGNLDAIRQHINAASDLNQKDAYGSTPLIVAATFGRTEVARVLIDAGADMKITNNEGATPLHIAAFLCRNEIVKTLLDKGADKNALNKAGRNALESVSRSFDDVKGIYDGLGAALAPLGLKLDYERIKRTRLRIAEMLR